MFSKQNILFMVLILAVCLTQFASDIYAPSIVAIELGLHTSISLVQMSMSVYMLGVALSQLVYGPLSEGFGRKPPMLVGLLIMGVGSLVCALSAHIEPLIVGRLIQGIGAGACACLWRSVFRDNFKGEELSKYGSYAVIMVMFIVPAAPLLGAYLQKIFSWHASFVFVAGYVLIAFVGLVVGLHETHTSFHIDKIKPRMIVSHYGRLLKSPLFMGITCATFLSYGAYFSWFVAGPVLLIKDVGVSATTFAWLNALGCGGAYALAGIINGKVVKRFGMPTMMRLGWSLMITGGLLLTITHFMLPMNAWTIMIPVILFYFGSTFIWPNAFATAFTPFGDIAGYAGALYGFMLILGAAVLAALVALLKGDNQLNFAMIMIACSALAWLIYEVAMRRHRMQEYCSKN